MVSNAEVEREFAMFAEVWKVFKRLLPVGTQEDEAYWGRAVEEINIFMNQYPDPLGRSLAMVVLEELERKSKDVKEHV